jgi:signal transduction histidine kinase
VSVSDDGPGISPQMTPRLFEPFASDKETGLGLGLVVSKRIAEDHGGGLEGHNRPGGGACFVLTLPGDNGAAGVTTAPQKSRA